jgi:hypothetical protein
LGGRRSNQGFFVRGSVNCGESFSLHASAGMNTNGRFLY